MSENKPLYKIVSAVFIALTVVFASSTAYFLAVPNTMIQPQIMTEMQTEVVTTTEVSSVSSPLYSVNVAYSPSVGFFLTNSTGWTLYIFTRDIPTNGTSRCTGNCLNIWPAFYTASLVLPSGLNATNFTVITRPDGTKQIAYDGWPLYYYASDKKAGDITGEGVGKVWYAATVPKLSMGQ